MLIDMHGHVRRYPSIGLVVGSDMRLSCHDNFHTPEQLIARHDELGIDKAVLLPLVSSEVYEPQSNAEVLYICDEYPDRFIPFCNIDPRAFCNSPESPFADLLALYKARGCKGVGEITANLAFDDPKVENLFAACEKQQMPVLFHCASAVGSGYGLYDEPGLPLLEKTLARFPDLIFIGHSTVFWAEISAMDSPARREEYASEPVKQEGAVPKLLRKYKNLHADLSAGSGYSAIARDLKYGPAFLEEFQDRLYFGTDLCAPNRPMPNPDFFRKLRDDGLISRDCYEKIAHINAERLLGIKA